MSGLKLAIIDYRMGNLTSVANAIRALGTEPIVASTPEALQEASHVILPGVGSFAKGMARLHEFGFVSEIRRLCLEEKKPVLGICLGMQLLADRGLEGGDTAGLGLIPGVVRRLESQGLRLPHIGWNEIQLQGVHPLLPFALDQKPHFYFVHSFIFDAHAREDVLATCDYGENFAAVVGRGLAMGAQFHPEKSQNAGLRLLKAFTQVRNEMPRTTSLNRQACESALR